MSRIKELVATRPDVKGIRVGLKKKGCSGLAYTMDFVDKDDPVKGDTPVKQDGTPWGSCFLQAGAHPARPTDVILYVSSKAEMALLGSEMDYVDNDLHAEFVFTNPRAKGVCGCGESFTT